LSADYIGLSADFAGLSGPISAQISIVAQAYAVIGVDKESVNLDSYNIIKVANRDRSFYGKKDVIAVEGDTLYW